MLEEDEISIGKPLYGKSPEQDVLADIKLLNTMTIENFNIQAAWEEYARLAGIDIHRKPFSRWQKFKWRMQDLFERAHDAWEVLKGNRIDD